MHGEHKKKGRRDTQSSYWFTHNLGLCLDPTIIRFSLTQAPHQVFFFFKPPQAFTVFSTTLQAFSSILSKSLLRFQSKYYFLKPLQASPKYSFENPLQVLPQYFLNLCRLYPIILSKSISKLHTQSSCCYLTHIAIVVLT